MDQNKIEIDAFEYYDLYNEDIHNFFQKNYVSKNSYKKGEKINTESSKAVSYISLGYCKIYLVNSNGDEMFNGYIPQYSVLFKSPGVDLLSKYSIANTDTEIYTASFNDYVYFLQSNPLCIAHQLYEPYYRRNFNDYPHYESISQSARLKVYYYIRYVALRFGKTSPVNEFNIVLYNPPSSKDIAHYNDIHPNNVITFMNDLKRKGIIHRSKDKLTIIDTRLLDKEISSLRK